MTVAITEAITTLAEAERRFNLTRTEDNGFFPEWQRHLPELGAERRFNLTRTEDNGFFPEWQRHLPELGTAEQTALSDVRRRYLYQRSESQLLEGTVTLLLVSSLLTVAGFYDPPFKVRAEEAVQLTLNDGEEVLRGRIDVLVLLNRFWVVILESKKTALSTWVALPQTLAYLMANPQAGRPSFAMVTNGDGILFVKLRHHPVPCYAVSRVFAPFASGHELTTALRVLKNLGQVAGENIE